MLKLLDTVSKMTYLLRQATREIEPAKTNPVKEYEEDLGKNEGEWIEKTEIKARKKLIVVGETRMAIF